MLISCQTDSLVLCAAYGMESSLLKHRCSNACILRSVSADRVHASQPYIAVATMTVCINLILDVMVLVSRLFLTWLVHQLPWQSCILFLR